MSDPKQVNALDDLISAWWLEQDEPTIVHDGVEYLASTHLAEALIAAGWVSPEEYAATIARVQARLDEEGPCLDRYLGAATCDHPGCVLERDIRAALAEPTEPQ